MNSKDSKNLKADKFLNESNQRKSVNNVYDSNPDRTQKRRDVITENILYASNPVLQSHVPKNTKSGNKSKEIITDNILYESRNQHQISRNSVSKKPKSLNSKKDIITDNILYETNQTVLKNNKNEDIKMDNTYYEIRENNY